jgi:phosphoribosylanthranilate isomerase
MKVKVCGLRQAENIEAIQALDVDYLGFIRYAESPRYVSDNQMQVISSLNLQSEKVGVYVNENMSKIMDDVDQLKLDVIQLHGDEDVKFVESLLASGTQVFKAIGVHDQTTLANAKEFSELSSTYSDKLIMLLDTKTKKRGGSGQQWDWNLLNGFDQPFLLSGGIGPEDFDKIKKLQHPFLKGIDLNSRFESSPAMKEVKTVKEFLNNLNK